MPLPLIDRVMTLETQVRLLETFLKGALEKLDRVDGFLTDLHESRVRAKALMMKARKAQKRAKK